MRESMRVSVHEPVRARSPDRDDVESYVWNFSEAVQVYAVRLVRREVFRELCGEGHQCFLDEENLIRRSVSEIRTRYWALAQKDRIPYLVLFVFLRRTIRGVLTRERLCDGVTAMVVWSRLAWPDLSFILD